LKILLKDLVGSNCWHYALSVGNYSSGAVYVDSPAAEKINADCPQAKITGDVENNLAPIRIPASAEIANSRLAICGTCDRNRAGQCADCVTCGAARRVEDKVAAAFEACPRGKWTAICVAYS